MKTFMQISFPREQNSNRRLTPTVAVPPSKRNPGLPKRQPGLPKRQPRLRGSEITFQLHSESLSLAYLSKFRLICMSGKADLSASIFLGSFRRNFLKLGKLFLNVWIRVKTYFFIWLKI